LNTNKAETFLRLAQKARKLEIGKTAVRILLKRKRASLVLVAADASDKLRNQIEVDCRRYNVPLYIFATKAALGALCGRESVAVVAVSDKNLAEGIKKAFV